MKENRSLTEFASPVLFLIYASLAFTFTSPWLLLNWSLTKIFPRLRLSQNDTLITAREFTTKVRIGRGHGRWYQESCTIPAGTVWTSHQDFKAWLPVYELHPLDMLGNTHITMSEDGRVLDYFKSGEIRLGPIQLLRGKMTKFAKETPNQAL